jgi:hypothetical protein
MDDAPNLGLIQSWSQHAIIWGDEMMFGCLDDDRSSCPPDSRVDDNEKDSVGRKIGTARREHDRRLANALWRYLMADIDQLEVGVDTEHDPLHGPDKGITLAEICQQGNDS